MAACIYRKNHVCKCILYELVFWVYAVPQLNGTDVYRQLVDAIENGSLTPGTRLREIELAERYGVSRTPIREGLKRLESQGLAVHEPNRGMVIPVLDNDQLNELYVVRAMLEGLVARLAAQHASDAEIAILQDMIAHDRQSAGNAQRLAASNRAFHQRLTLASHNRFLKAQIDHMKQSMLLLGGTTFDDPERREHAMAEHEAIIAAVSSRDSVAAEQAGRTHIEAAHKARLLHST